MSVQESKQSKPRPKQVKGNSKLRSPPGDLILECPNWVAKTVVPCFGDNQIIVFQAFVGLGKARYQPYLVRPGFQVIRLGKAMSLVQVNNIVS